MTRNCNAVVVRRVDSLRTRQPQASHTTVNAETRITTRVSRYTHGVPVCKYEGDIESYTPRGVPNASKEA